MRRYVLAVMVMLLTLWLASSLEGQQKRRSARSTSPLVDMVLYVRKVDGKTIVSGRPSVSLRLAVGAEYTASAQIPGRSQPVPLPGFLRVDASSTYESFHFTLFNSAEPCLEDAAGIRTCWDSGVVDFRLERVLNGITTAALHEVQVWDSVVDFPPGYNAFPSPDGLSIKLSGFPSGSVAMLNGIVAEIVHTPSGMQVMVPKYRGGEYVSGLGIPLAVCHGYPESRCWTKTVDVPGA